MATAERHRAAALSLAIAIGLSSGTSWAFAQDNTGPGEQRFNAGIYKASHNTYERDETYASQIDSWNCWCLEFDLVWHFDDEVRVQHLCGDFGGLLAGHLQSAALSIEAGERVTVIYLEMKDCFDWPARSVYRDYIRNVAEAAFGSAIYTAAEFKTVDQSHWPSYQELLRRGYYWIIILDEEATSFADDDFFFGIARGNPPSTFEPNSVLVNSGNDDMVPDRGTQPDRWMFRAYPTPFCDAGDDESYYDDAIANGYTFVATNCIDRHYTMTHTTHSASPLHVVPGGSGTQFGTLPFPYRGAAGLVNAVERASPMVPIKIEPGDYDVPGGTRLNGPVILNADEGVVRIL